MQPTRHSIRLFAVITAICGLFCTSLGADPRPTYHSPYDVAFSPDGRWLAVTDHTAGKVVVFATSTRKTIWSADLQGSPAGVVWQRDAKAVFVAEHDSDQVARIDRSGRVFRFQVGSHPVGLAMADELNLLLSADSGNGEVSMAGAGVLHVGMSIQARREPHFVACSPKANMIVIGNRLPLGPATDEEISAAITLLNFGDEKPWLNHVRLPPNSVNVLGVALSPCGKWAYAVHNLARATLPTEQIEYGWINANALTIIDLESRQRYATILLDRPGHGAANPWGIAVSPDGNTAWITLSGIHELGRLDVKRLHRQLEDRLAHAADDATNDGARSTDTITRGASVYAEATERPEDPTAVELVVSRLPPQYGRGVFLPGVFRRTRLPGNGPRAVDISPDGKRLAVAQYFSGNVLLIDTATTKIIKTLTWGEQPSADDVRRGETIFHDANFCYEHWLSCATCHPDGRADGLNWDLLNDGIGTPKNTRSLLLSHKTPPAMWHGVRADMPAAVAAGFEHILFQPAEPEVRHAVEAYIRSLTPRQEPPIPEFLRADNPEAGRRLFESRQTGCAVCHPAPLLTDLKMHDVGTGDENGESSRYDTPTLVEIRRTAPYLHDGRAVTLEDVIRRFNRDDRHGKTSHLSDDEISDLVDYLRSL